MPATESRKLQLNKVKPHKDVVHDYVYVTAFEEFLIDTPDFQRLRHVRQNSAAFKTFSGNHLERFSHSMGVMHLGGLMFVNALKNSEQDVFESFCDEVSKLIHKLFTNGHFSFDFNTLSPYWNSNIGNLSDFPVARILHLDKEKILDYTFSVNIIWQSIRVACLMHDVGHLPFSHIFEEALFHLREEADTIVNEIGKVLVENGFRLAKAEKIHELIGIRLFFGLLPTSTGREFPDQKSMELFRLIKILSIKLFASTRAQIPSIDGTPILKMLYKTIISGEIDADRVDYTLRDRYYAGIDMGDFDSQRLLGSMKLIKDQDSAFRIVVTDKAISSIEQFFDNRFRLYKYFIFHHNVARFNGILREIIVVIIGRLLNPASQENEAFAKIWKSYFWHGKDWGAGSSKVINVEMFKYIDDNTLLELLKTTLLHVEQHQLPTNRRLRLLLQTFLFRQSWNIVSLWKRDNQAVDFVKDIQTKLGDSSFEYNSILRALQGKLSFGEPQFFAGVLSSIQSRLDTETDCSVQLIHSFVLPPTYKKSENSAASQDVGTVPEDEFPMMVETKLFGATGYDTKLLNIWQVSVDLNSLYNEAEQIVPHQFAFVAEQIKSNQSLIQKCKDITLEEVTQFIATSLTTSEMETPKTREL